MTKLIGVAAALEAAIGLALMIDPPLVTGLLLAAAYPGLG